MNTELSTKKMKALLKERLLSNARRKAVREAIFSEEIPIELIQQSQYVSDIILKSPDDDVNWDQALKLMSSSATDFLNDALESINSAITKHKGKNKKIRLIIKEETTNRIKAFKDYLIKTANYIIPKPDIDKIQKIHNHFAEKLYYEIDNLLDKKEKRDFLQYFIIVDAWLEFSEYCSEHTTSVATDIMDFMDQFETGTVLATK